MLYMDSKEWGVKKYTGVSRQQDGTDITEWKLKGNS